MSTLNNSIYTIQSNQRQCAAALTKHWQQYRNPHSWQRPISQHARHSFRQIHAQIQAEPRPIIIDSGCGRGKSSRQLAQQYPQHWIVAIDKSHVRLERLNHHQQPLNLLIMHTNCEDAWRLLYQLREQIQLHCIFYPNPWPKKKQLQRRWHAHPCLHYYLNLAKTTRIRSNWLLYLQEAQFVAQLSQCTTKLQQLHHTMPAVSHFEAKYFLHQQPCYELISQRSLPVRTLSANRT